MDMVTLIQTLGFPVACVCALGFYVYKSNLFYREDIERLNDSTKTALSGMRDALNANTIMLTKLSTLLESEIAKAGNDNHD